MRDLGIKIKGIIESVNKGKITTLRATIFKNQIIEQYSELGLQLEEIETFVALIQLLEGAIEGVKLARIRVSSHDMFLTAKKHYKEILANKKDNEKSQEETNAYNHMVRCASFHYRATMDYQEHLEYIKNFPSVPVPNN